MAHEIETYSDGTGSMYSARVTPWHHLGVVTPEAVTPREALRLARADYEVFKTATRYAVPTLEGVSEDGTLIEGTEWVDDPGNYSTYRIHPETGRPVRLGKGLGEDFTVVQNTETVGFMEALLDVSDARIETCGVLYDGSQMFATMKMPEGIMVGGIDPVDMYMVVSNGHDGRRALTVDITPIRVVCKNTLTYGHARAVTSVKIRHTRNAVHNLEQARRTLEITFQAEDAFQAQANALVEQAYTTGEFEALIKQVWPVKENTTNTRTLNGVEARTTHLMRLWNSDDTQENIRGTKWAALNAVAEYADWFTPVRAESENEARALRITGGSVLVAQPKRKALALLSN